MVNEKVLSYEQGIEIANETAQRFSQERTETDQRFLQEKIALSSTGSGSALSITLPDPIPDKYIVKFICDHDTSGNITINNIPCYKPGTTTSPSLKNGRMYEFWYNAATPCFFFKASASGNATANDVLAGKTFSNDDDVDIVGNIQNKGTVSLNLGIDSTYDYNKSYFERLQIKTNIIQQPSGVTGTSCAMYNNYFYTRIPEGYYRGGNWDNGAAKSEVKIEQSKVASAIGLHAGILLAGQNILGINGNVQPRLVQQGTATSNDESTPWFTINGLSFEPNYIMAVSNDRHYTERVIFMFEKSKTLIYEQYSSSSDYFQCLSMHTGSGYSWTTNEWHYSNGTFQARIYSPEIYHNRSFIYVAIG